MNQQSISTQPSNYLFTNRQLWQLIIPLMIEQFLLIFVGLADSVMVASVGEAAVSAVSLIDTIMVLIINLFAALGSGGAIVAGQALGRKSESDACQASEQTLLFSTLFSLVITGLMFLGRDFILHVVFGQIEADVMANCSTYLLIVAPSIPFLAVYNVGAAMFRAMGNSKTPMKMSIVMNTMNLVGNAVLLYGLKWGIEGAALPTLLSRVFAGVWMFFLIQRRKYTIRVRTITGLRLIPSVMKRILHLGIPYAMENSMFQLGKVIVLSLVTGFGTASIAANAVSNSIAMFAILGGMSINYALSSVSARCVGANDFDQVRYYTRKMMKYCYIILLISNVLILLLLPFIIFIYNLSPETSQMVRQIILFHSISAIFVWAPSFTLPNTLRSANDVTFCMVVCIISMWIFRIGFSYLLGDFVGLGVLGVWMAMVIDWAVRAVFFLIRYRGKKWSYGL